MSGDTTGDVAIGDVTRSADLCLIDTDVHESTRSPQDLMPYLDPHWQRQLANWNTLPGRGPIYALPGHLMREDWKLADGSYAWDIATLSHHVFDELGVAIAILNNPTHLSTTPHSPEWMAAEARAYTDWQIDQWLEKEPRLRGSVYVTANDPAAAAVEIDRAAEHPQIVQVFLPLVTDCEYGDPFFRPIFEAAIRNGLVVTMHHGPFTSIGFGANGYPRYFIQWHTAAQVQASQNQLTSLICNGLFDRYSGLKVIFLEPGVGWVAPFMWRLDQQYRELRSEIPWVKRLPSEHIRDHVRFSTQPMGDLTPKQFKTLVEMADIEDLFMFASDYPHYDADTPDVVLPRSLPDDLRRRVRYQNALETYPRLTGVVVP